MATTTNVVNLDALIRRADLAAPGEPGDYIGDMSIAGLEERGFLYPTLRKPDFQRETSNWSPEQVAELILTFARGDLVPSVILWQSGANVFVIDGAHRLSAMIAWVNNDYGNGTISRNYFQNNIPDAQIRAAEKTRDIVNSAIGTYEAHRSAIDYPDKTNPEILARANRIGWQKIPAQWIRNADHDKAEKSFFRINQGGTKIDFTEYRILNSKRSATALAARLIVRAGTGHDYWSKFEISKRDYIEKLGGEIHKILYEPILSLPIKTLDLPVAGHSYGSHILPFVFDLVVIANDVNIPDSSKKRLSKPEGLPDDSDGEDTIRYLNNVRTVLRRLCSNHASSLGLHPALYFYSKSGVFQPAALLTYVTLFKDWNTYEFREFCEVRASFEEFLLANRGITEAVRRLGSGNRSRPRIRSLFKRLISDFSSGKTSGDVRLGLLNDKDYDFIIADEIGAAIIEQSEKSKFSRDNKGAAYIKDALPTAPKCKACGGLLHHNGMQVGHVHARRDGGSNNLENTMMQHPFCNSTMAN